MLLLPNGCSCSEPSVFPKNWNAKGADINCSWYLQYYFYAPNCKPKLKIVKGGLNKLKNLQDRRLAVPILKAELLHLLKVEGFNPLTKQTVNTDNYTVNHNTPFLEALDFAFKSLKTVKQTGTDIRNILVHVGKAAEDLRLNLYRIGDIKRRNIKTLLSHIENSKEYWSANTFNYYRKYVSILFSVFVEWEIFEANPVFAIKRQNHIQEPRATLSVADRNRINTELKNEDYNFWRYINIFFHSGARSTELLRIKKSDIDIERQRFRVLVKKGQSGKWEDRTIKDIALPLWEELYKVATDADYIFAKFLEPGTIPICASQINKRWRRKVKIGMGISADFYSLKHSNIDETAALLDINAAAAMAGHSTPIITLKHYALGEKERQHERLKTVSNKF